jgi:ABC-type lipoprotein export system ATPase subunit
MYRLTDVTKDYPKGRGVVHALRGVSVVIEDGDWLAIQGPAGHGKSTLLQILGALTGLGKASSRRYARPRSASSSRPST